MPANTSRIFSACRLTVLYFMPTRLLFLGLAAPSVPVASCVLGSSSSSSSSSSSWSPAFPPLG
eukprot:2461782-Pleurochrysis_carterae.AAC.1